MPEPEPLLSEQTRTLLAEVTRRIEGYAGGDRPPSPPAWLLKLRSDLKDAITEMTTRIMASDH